MPENYSNPKITNPIIPPQPSEYIEEYTETVQEPKNDGGEGDGSNDKPTPKPDNEKPQPKPDDESHHEEEAPKPEEDAPKPEETEPKEEDEEEGGLEEQNPIEDKDDAQGNFFEDNKGLLTRVYNILKLRFPNSNVSLPQLLTGAQQYIDMIAAPPGGGGGQPTGTGQGQNQAATIKPEDIKESDLDDIIKKYNAINVASSKRFFAQYLGKKENDINNATEITAYDEKTNQYITYNLKEWIDEKVSEPKGLYSIITKQDIGNDSNKNILKEVLSDFYNYVVTRSGKSPKNINTNIEFLMYIYDYLTEALSYSSEDTTLFNSFKNKKADCSHFAYAVVFLCCYANHIHENNKYITIDYVTWGVYRDNKIILNSPVGHLFNSTKINNKWYYIDASVNQYYYNHKHFLFQDAFEYNKEYKESENRKSIGTINKLRNGIELKSNDITIPNSQLFYDHFLKNRLINLDLKKLTSEFINDFTNKFNNILINNKTDLSKISSKLNERTALLQNKKFLYIAFSFHSKLDDFELIQIENPDPKATTKTTSTPLIFLFIIWLVEKMALPSIIEIITNGSINNDIQSTFDAKNQQLAYIFKKLQSKYKVKMEVTAPIKTKIKNDDILYINQYYSLAYFIR